MAVIHYEHGQPCMQVELDQSDHAVRKVQTLHGLLTHATRHVHMRNTGVIQLYIQLAPWQYTTDHIRSWSLQVLQVITLQLVSGVS